MEKGTGSVKSTWVLVRDRDLDLDPDRDLHDSLGDQKLRRRKDLKPRLDFFRFFPSNSSGRS
jgi:hypothetical protein